MERWILLPKTQTIRLSGRFSWRRNLLPIRPAPDLETADPDTIDKYYESVNLEQEVACLMLSSMSPDLRRTLKKYNAFDMMKELETMFEEQAKQERFETVKAFHACKQEDGQSVNSYLLKMKSYLDTLERLGYAMPKELGVSLILNSLNKDYDYFLQNNNMQSMGKTLAELHAMLKLHEKGGKGKAKRKNKLTYAPKTKISPPPKRDNPKKDSIYHHCKEVGHWRRNCLSYHAELKKRTNASMASTLDIFTIELYVIPNNTWVYDTGCETHICNTSHGLRGSRKLKHEALNLYIGNGMRAAVEAIISFDLILPSYPKETMGYYFYYPLENKIFISRNAEFFKNSFMVQQASGSHGLLEMSGSDKGLEMIQKEDTQPSENTSKEHNEVAPIKVEP
ncbi:zinc finger, CCHC-type containing protein [Tanacetum coccineum]